MNKKVAIVIGLQALIIVILSWMLVFLGQDEFEELQEEQEEEIESLDRVTEEDGISIVQLPPAVQKNSGISTARVTSMSYQDAIKSFGTVVAIDEVIDAMAKTIHLKSELAALRTTGKQNTQQYQKLKALNADNKNVSDLAVQQALTLVNNDQASINSKQLQIKHINTNIKLKWGTPFAQFIAGHKGNPLFRKLVSREHVLLQISLPFDVLDPKNGDQIEITPLNGHRPITATYLAVASVADSNGVGKTFYYTAPAHQLRTGMRVSVEASTNQESIHDGIVIPSDAVVWYAGTPWAYFKQGEDQFIRKPISAETEVDAGWFNQGFDVNSEVVVSGAQLLLSEEFKYLIKNENDD